MNKMICAGLLVALLPGCTPTEPEVADSPPAPTGCWQHTISHEGWAPNTLTVCRDDSGSTRSIYYPNPDTQRPTTCNQRGTADAEGGVIAFRFREGDCENGRIVAAEELPCTVVSDDELSCTIVDVPGFRFVRTPQGI